MARILIGWELGGNRGHIRRIASLTARLRAEGNNVAVALQRIDSAAAELPAGVEVWQAPVWPRLLANAAHSWGAQPATMGDILFRLGLDRPEALGALVRGWETILGASRADVVVADFAPALLRAAAGRAPTIGVGTGFDRPPTQLDSFPSLNGAAPAHDEQAALANANAGLKAAARPLLAALPELFAADRSLAATFIETDPYAAHRLEPVVAPTVPLPLPPPATGDGEEVFVYGVEMMRADAALWKGLHASGLPMRVHVPNALPSFVDTLRGYGFAFEAEPLPWSEIVRRSRLVVSHGGQGFVSCALIAGLPQVVTHYDLEKRIHAQALVRTRLGGAVPLGAIKPEPFAASLKALYADEAFAVRARAAAPSFRARCSPTFEDQVVTTIAAVCGT